MMRVARANLRLAGRRFSTAPASAAGEGGPVGGRPGARKEEMADAAAKVGDGKSNWQRFVGGVVDTVRPVAAKLAPTVMPMLDGPAMRRVEQAVNIEDLRVAAEKRAHAMVYGYLAGGADDERALRRSVAAYNDVELRHAVLHGIGHADMDLRTKILGVDTELPFFVTSCAAPPPHPSASPTGPGPGPDPGPDPDPDPEPEPGPDTPTLASGLSLLPTPTPTLTRCAGQRMFHADGEVATARAAKKHGCFMALSQLTTSTFEDVREAHPEGAKALQLYVWRDRVLLKEASNARVVRQSVSQLVPGRGETRRRGTV